MKTNIIKALFGLILTFSISGLYAQSPRIKLNQIVKDTVSGSVLISNLADSNMVYSRNFYIGSDTSLVFFGTTIVAGGGGGGSFVTLPQLTDSLALYATKVQLSDSMATVLKQVATDLTLTGLGTDASPLKVDTSVIATVSALRDSLAGIISSVSTDITLTGDGSVGNPLKVDTTTYIATKGDLNLYYLASNPNGYTSDTGTVTSVAATAGTGISISGSPITGAGTLTITNTAPDQTVSITGAGINAVSGTYPNFTITGTEVDGSVTNEIQDISTSGAAGNISISSGSTLNLNVNDADASATNEGSLTVGAGTASTSVISSNTSGSTDVTLTAGSNITLSETGNNITIAATGGGASYNNISETADTVYISDYLNVDTATLYVDATNNRVGIGTTSPSVPLSIGADGDTLFSNSVGRFARFSNASNTGGFNMGYSITEQLGVFTSQGANSGFSYWTNNGSWGERMRIHTNGNVGIGTTSPSYDLHVVDDIFASDSIIGTSFVGTSDSRLKQDIELINNGIENILKLNPVSYRYIIDSSNVNKRFGFIAQEVEAFLPNLVSERFDGMKLLNYLDIIPINTKAIQEQQAIIQSQATEIESLKSQIQLILNEIQILKNN